MNHTPYESEDLVALVVEGMREKKGKDIIVMDLQEVDHAITNFFVICHGSSKPQLEAIADYVIMLGSRELGVRPWHKEGFENAEWILIDYVDVVVHVFREDRRQFYQLEKLWADALITEYENAD